MGGWGAIAVGEEDLHEWPACKMKCDSIITSCMPNSTCRPARTVGLGEGVGWPFSQEHLCGIMRAHPNACKTLAVSDRDLPHATPPASMQRLMSNLFVLQCKPGVKPIRRTRVSTEFE